MTPLMPLMLLGTLLGLAVIYAVHRVFGGDARLIVCILGILVSLLVIGLTLSGCNATEPPCSTVLDGATPRLDGGALPDQLPAACVDGVRTFGSCWILSAPGQSCNEACAARGSIFDAEHAQHIGFVILPLLGCPTRGTWPHPALESYYRKSTTECLGGESVGALPTGDERGRNGVGYACACQ